MKIVRNAAKTIVFLVVSFNASIWLFIIGYKLYMPKVQFTLPLKFNHSPDQITATADLNSCSRYLNKWSTKYSIWLHLIVPDNPTNLAIGNFTATLHCAQFSESTPLIMRYESFITKTSKCLLKLPLYLTGYWWEEQHLKGLLLRDTKVRPQSVDVSILTGRLQIYKGYLSFEAKLSMLQHIYHHYFIPSALVSIWLIFSYLVISSSLVGVFLYWKNYQKNVAISGEEEETFGLEALFE